MFHYTTPAFSLTTQYVASTYLCLRSVYIARSKIVAVLETARLVVTKDKGTGKRLSRDPHFHKRTSQCLDLLLSGPER